MLNSSQTFYHGTTEKAIIAFGNLFSNIYIERYDSNGVLKKRIQVPCSYAPKEKFLSRERQQPDIDKQTEELTLPRLAFEITGISRDSSRQMNGNMLRRGVVNGQVNSSFNPVPYDLTVTLYAVAKTQSDALQMFEQIVPTFNPSYTLTMNAMPELGMTDDLPITLDSVSHEDNYDDAFEKRRQIMWIFTFTLQLNYFGYVDMNRGPIKYVDTTMFGSTDVTSAIPMEGIGIAVSPASANITDTYTVVTEIDGFL